MAAPMKSPAPITATEALRVFSIAVGSSLRPGFARRGPARGLPGELLLQDLAGGVGRQGVEQDDLGRALVRGEPRGGESSEIRRAGGCAGAQLDEGDHLLV